jgi:hypothetical protein
VAGGLPSNTYAYTFLCAATGTPNYGGGNYPTTGFAEIVPATVGAVPPFTISAVPSSTAVFATGSSGTGTPVTVTINPVNGSTPSQITFSLSNQGYTVQTTVNRPSSTPAGSSWPATFIIYAASSATSGPVIINASAGGSGTVAFSMWLNVNPPFNLSASPGSQTANSAGIATYQISVNGGNNFIGLVGLTFFSSPALPPGTSVGFGQSTVSAPGMTLLTITVPPTFAQATYNLTVSIWEGSSPRLQATASARSAAQ